jgi:hypothetical protein
MARKRKASPNGGSYTPKTSRPAGKTTQQSTGKRNKSTPPTSKRPSTRLNPGDYVEDSLPYGGRESLVLRSRAVHAREKTPDHTPSPEAQTDSFQQQSPDVPAQQGPLEPKKSFQDSAVWGIKTRRPDEINTERLVDWKTEWRHTPETDVLPAYAHVPTRAMQFGKPETNDAPLPVGWQEQVVSGTTTYLDARTGRIQKDRPPYEDLLPAGWWSLKSGSFEGGMLYLHWESHSYQRTRPTEEYLAQGWIKKTDSLGTVSYYHADGSAQSQRPTEVVLPPGWWRRICSNGSIAYTHPPSRTEQRASPPSDYLPDGWQRQGDLFVHQDGTTQSHQPQWDRLPDGWWMRLTDDRSRLYVNRENRIVQYTRPTGEYLPPGWEHKCKDEKWGKTYFYGHPTEGEQANRPKEEALPPGWWIRIATDGVRTYVNYETRTEQHIDNRPSFNE